MTRAEKFVDFSANFLADARLCEWGKIEEIDNEEIDNASSIRILPSYCEIIHQSTASTHQLLRLIARLHTLRQFPQHTCSFAVNIALVYVSLVQTTPITS